MKEEKQKNIFKILILIIIFIFAFLIIRNTYSKYMTAEDSSTKSHIAQWNILLNDQDISENKVFSNYIPLQLDENENINQNIIAPTSKGHINLSLESTGTELPYEYEIQLAEGVPTDSTYTLTSNNNWPGPNGTQIYEVTLKFTTFDYDGPISGWSAQPDGTWGPTYGYPVLQFAVPDNFVLDSSNIWWANSIKQEGNVLTFETKEWAWTYDADLGANTFEQRLQLAYNTSTAIDTDNFIDDVVFDGKVMIDSVLPDFRVYAYSLNGGEIIELADDEIILKGTVYPAVDADGNFTNATVKNDFVLYVEWYDKEDNIFDNQNDVIVSKLAEAVATINLNVQVTQIDENATP